MRIASEENKNFFFSKKIICDYDVVPNHPHLRKIVEAKVPGRLLLWLGFSKKYVVFVGRVRWHRQLDDGKQKLASYPKEVFLSRISQNLEMKLHQIMKAKIIKGQCGAFHAK